MLAYVKRRRLVHGFALVALCYCGGLSCGDGGAPAGSGGSRVASGQGEPEASAGAGAGDVSAAAGAGGAVTTVTTSPPQPLTGAECLGTRIDTDRPARRRHANWTSYDTVVSPLGELGASTVMRVLLEGGTPTMLASGTLQPLAPKTLSPRG